MLHDFTNTTGSYLVLGDGKNRLVIAPGATQAFEADLLTSEDIAQIDAGEFTVDPALPAGIEDIVDAGSQAGLNSKIVEWILSNDTQIIFEDAAGGTIFDNGQANDYILCVTDGDGTIDTFNDTGEVTVVVAAGGGTVNSSMPLSFEDGKAVVSLTRTESSVTFGLASGPAGLDISSEIDLAT